MKSYQSAIATVATLGMGTMYCVLTARLDTLAYLMAAVVLATVWCVIALYNNKVREDALYANKYRTITVTRDIDESQVPAHIVASMHNDMCWDTEAFEESLKPIPFINFNTTIEEDIKAEGLEFEYKLALLVEELDNM